jgi:hypothetical protein
VFSYCTLLLKICDKLFHYGRVHYLVGYEVLTAVSTKMAVFWVVAPCGLAEVYQRFRGPCCLHHKGDEYSRRYNPKDSHLSPLLVTCFCVQRIRGHKITTFRKLGLVQLSKLAQPGGPANGFSVIFPLFYFMTKPESGFWNVVVLWFCNLDNGQSPKDNFTHCNVPSPETFKFQIGNCGQRFLTTFPILRNAGDISSCRNILFTSVIKFCNCCWKQYSIETVWKPN